MSAVVHIDPKDAAPIWRQIEDGVRRLVASGALAPGAPVPSVRELARELRINPATVAKGYQRLVDAGVLLVRRGEGTFVADNPPPTTATERREELAAAARRFAALAATLGAGRSETVNSIEKAWDEFAAARKGRGQ